MSPEVLKRKIISLHQHLEVLKKYKDANENELIIDNYYTIERAMQLLVDTAIDLCAHLLKSKYRVGVFSAKEVFKKAAENKLISRELSEEFYDIVQFRNALVHTYGELQHYQVLEKIVVFVAAFEKFIKEAKEIEI